MPEEDDHSAYFDFNKQYAHSGPYETELSANEEKQYKKWLGEVSKQYGRKIQEDPSYDMRGLFKYHVQTGNWNPDASGHFPDTFKTPYHPTFSRESMYAKPDAPFWRGDTLIDPTTGNPTPGFLDEVLRK